MGLAPGRRKPEVPRTSNGRTFCGHDGWVPGTLGSGQGPQSTSQKPREPRGRAGDSTTHDTRVCVCV